MAKFTQSQLDRIKRELKIKELAESQGLQLARKNGQFVTRCLWHRDNDPSLFIHPDKNLFNCFGCDAGGDVVEWVMKSFKMEFSRSIEWILNRYPHLKEETESTSPEKSECPLDPSVDDQAFLHQVLDFYHQKLLEDKQAQDYLASRGILDTEAIGLHKIGWADRDLSRALPSYSTKAGRQLRDRLAELGIYRRQSGHGHFNGCVVFPVLDTENNVREIYGRKITRNLRKGTPDHMYLAEDCQPFEDRGIWNEGTLSHHTEIILCESIIDALSFWCAGYQNVTAIYGTQGLTPYHLAAFKKYNTQKLLLALDRDEAGKKATQQHSKTLIDAGLTVYEIDFPAGMDANEYGLKVKTAGEKSSLNFDLVIRSATWMGGVIEESAAKEEKVQSDSSSSETTELNGESTKAAIELPTETETAGSAPASQASQSGPAVSSTIEADVKEQEVEFTFGERVYRVRGLERNHSYDTLKINLLGRRGEHFHVDTFDLYQSRPRAAFIKMAAIELSLEETIIKRDLGNILLKLEQLQEEQIQAAQSKNEQVEVEIEPADREEALKLLKSENLLDQILLDFDACGVVGEENNKLIGYLAAISRKLNDPLAILIQSSSAAGKSSLMDAVLSFVPEEDKVAYSAMTGQSLYYMGGGDLKHRILAISEEGGVRQASYALKLLQSEGSLRIASTGKDPNTGRMETQEYTVEGPVMLFLTTTSYDIDEELLNRCLILSVCEDQSQTRAIHDIQRRRQTIEGLLAGHNRNAIITKHQNAQRLLKPLLVANNFATGLKFRSDRTRTRRDHAKYLTLIRAIALLHQHQREIKTVEQNGKQIQYIEVIQSDIDKADQLAAAVMARSYNELPDKTEQVLKAIIEMVHTACIDNHINLDDYRFTRKAVSQFLLANQMAISSTHLKRHLAVLEDREYLIVHSGGGRGRLKTYALDYQDTATTKEVHPKKEKSTRSPSEVLDFFSSRFFGSGGQNGQHN